MNRLLYISFCIVFIISCGPRSLPAKELVTYMEDADNKLRQTKIEGPVKYIVQYKNLDYVLAKKGDDIGTFNTNEFRKEIADKILFDLFITCDSGKVSPLQYNAFSGAEVNERYMYYQFRFGQDIRLEYGGNKIEPLYCISDKGSGLNNTMAFSIGFEKPAADADEYRLVINDKYLGSGTVKFLYKAGTLNNLPTIKL